MLITGATGLIGGELLRQFLKFALHTSNIGVLVRAKSPADAISRLSVRVGRHLVENAISRNTLKVFVGDITSNETYENPSLCKFLGQVDTIIHCAAETSFIRNRNCDRVNVDGLKRFTSCVHAINKSCRFVYFGTAAVCGKRTGVMSESMRISLKSEDHLWRYTYTKAIGEKIVTDIFPETYVILRPSVVIGSKTRRDARSVLWGMVITQLFDALPVVESMAGLDIVGVDDISKWTWDILSKKDLMGKILFLSGGSDSSQYTMIFHDVCNPL